MTTTSPDLICRLLASLWPAPARFAVIGPDGAARAGDAGLAARAAAALTGAPAAVRVVRDGDVVVVRGAVDADVIAADVPAAALPGLLEADLLRVTSAPA